MLGSACMLGQLGQKKILIVAAAVVAICVVALIFTFASSGEVGAGQDYVKSLESAPVQEIKASITQKKAKERQEALANGTMDVFGLFQDYVFFGDSRVYGFASFGLLDSSRVLASAGDNVSYVENYLDRVRNLMPSNVYLAYGINDMGMDLNGTYGYANIYKESVNKILEIVPDAHIYVCSIIPCGPAAVASSPAWADYPTYNEELQKMCEETGWTYIDCTSLADDGNADIYSDEGVHFVKSFYTTWAETIMVAEAEAQE